MLKLDRTQICESNGGTVAEDILWSSYFDSRSLVARNRLVLFYAPLVKYVASQVARVVGTLGVHPLDDLYQLGTMGLIDAVERFDPSDGYKFATYAGWRIHGAMIDGLREEDMLPKRKRAEVNEYQAAQRDLTSVMHRMPTTTETALHLGRPVSEVALLAIFASRGSAMASLSLLDSAVPDHVSEALLDFSLDPAEMAETNWTRECVKDALAALTERQRAALVLHYLEGFSKSEVAEMLGVDRSRVTQLLSQGLRNLQILLENTELRAYKHRET